ncbi:MAG: hypothetical protein RIG61_08785 [Deltaproteobacteria bacterium]
MKDYSESLPEPVRKFADPSRPKELRLMAARGLVPLIPKDITLVLYLLISDNDGEVSEHARKSLSEIPADVVSSVLGDPGTNSGLLDYFARTISDEKQLQKIILNNSARDDTIAYLAGAVHAQNLIELIANNHERIVRSADIVESLSKNPVITRSTLDAVIDYLKLYMGKKYDIPDLVHPEDAPVSQNPESEDAHEGEADYEVQESFLDDVDIDEELVEENDEDGEPSEIRHQNYQIQISMLNIGQKIKLAILGNREARTVLIKDPNRIVSKAVLKNPRLTDSEIVSISQSKIVSEDILREISDGRKWMRLYQVKLALVNNPKTPPHISVNLIRHLRDVDLKNLRWSKNLPGVLTTAVRQIIQDKRDRK